MLLYNRYCQGFNQFLTSCTIYYINVDLLHYYILYNGALLSLKTTMDHVPSLEVYVS